MAPELALASGASLAPGFLLGLGPLFGFFLAHPQDFAAQIGLVGIFQSGWFAQQQASGLTDLQIFALRLGMLSAGVRLPARSRPVLCHPHMALLDSASSVLFLLACWSRSGRRTVLDAALILAWLLGVPIFGGMMIVGTPESQRYIVFAAPALCLLIALGLQQRGSGGLGASVAGRQVYIISAIVIILLAGWNIHFYFAEYTPRNTYGGVNSETAEAVARYLHEQRDPVFAYFFGAPACSTIMAQFALWPLASVVRMSEPRSRWLMNSRRYQISSTDLYPHSGTCR